MLALNYEMTNWLWVNKKWVDFSAPCSVELVVQLKHTEGVESTLKTPNIETKKGRKQWASCYQSWMPQGVHLKILRMMWSIARERRPICCNQLILNSISSVETRLLRIVWILSILITDPTLSGCQTTEKLALFIFGRNTPFLILKSWFQFLIFSDNVLCNDWEVNQKINHLEV